MFGKKINLADNVQFIESSSGFLIFLRGARRRQNLVRTGSDHRLDQGPDHRSDDGSDRGSWIGSCQMKLELLRDKPK